LRGGAIMRVEIEGITYVVEKATPVKQKVGRPRKKQARFSLLLRRPKGSRLYASYLYHDNSFCRPI
ncbi:MAG: hypothetical protein ACE5IR_09505, partial [bacterium]